MMKKKILAIMATVLLVSLLGKLPQNMALASSVHSHDVIEGKLANGRVLIPLRAFSENLGAEVEWDNIEKQAFITFDDKVIDIRLNGTEVGIDYILTGLTLDVPMTMVDNITYLPFSFIGPVVGADVTWDNQIKQATVVYKGQTLLINGKVDPNVQLPTPPTQQRLDELYKKVNVAANITNYAQKRQQLSGYFTNEFIEKVIKNKGLTVYDKRYANQFRDPTFFYSNQSMYYASYYQSAFVNDSFYYGELSRNIIFKFVNGKWLVDDVMTNIVEPRP